MFKNPFLRRTEAFYLFFIRIGSNLQSLFILYMRLTWSYSLAEIGLRKLQGFDHSDTYFASVQANYPLLTSPFIGWVEVLCSFLLAIGLTSRIAAIPLIAIMLSVLSLSHGPDVSDVKFLLEPLLLVKQVPYPFLLTALLVFCFGPGRVSVDALLKRWSERRPRY
ncbi:MAG TPA: DoxX family protein [Chlamydiales bacterium]|nr:DoxX family protein [Chlamydiales bacterium]